MNILVNCDFSGKLDGNGKGITFPDVETVLFKKMLDGAVLLNTNIVNSKIEGLQAIACEISDGAKIYNCTVNGVKVENCKP